MKLLIALTLFAVVGLAAAECPEGCNGHGFCGEYDKCSCWRDWMGNSCADRICPYDLAYVDLPLGDLNMDGVGDQTIVTIGAQHNANYGYEVWPTRGATDAWAVGYDQAEDGHFYAECSNKGMCDRKSGLCSCFDGFEGTACRRTVCPNECSGHGTCESMEEMAGFASTSYLLWDRYKAQVCKCDPGYFGIDCASLHCPYGDDPLTTNQIDEVQYVDVHNTATALGGTFRLTYVDPYGETWDTNTINAVDYHISSDTTNVALAASIKTALQGIPNSVFTSVDVEVLPMQFPLPGFLAVGTDNINWGANGAAGTNNKFIEQKLAEVFTGTQADEWLVSNCLPVSASGAFSVVGDITANAIATTANTQGYAGHCKVRKHGFRAKVTFSSNPGDINNLGCDSSSLTGAGCTGTDTLVQETACCGRTASGNIINVNIDLNDVAAVGDRVTCGGTMYTIKTACTVATAVDGMTTCPVDEDITADVACTTHSAPALALVSSGTKELEECSHRGLCNYADGLCECFNGYTNDDCGRQDALSA